MLNSRPRSLVVSFLAVLTALVLSATATPADGLWEGFVDGPIVIGDQLYMGGEVEVRTHFRFGIVTVSINDEPVAAMFHKRSGPRSRGAKPSLVLRYGERGYPHLVALRWKDGEEQLLNQPPTTWTLRAASTVPGLATITPPAAAARPAEAIAGR